MRYYLLSEDETALTGLRLAGVEGRKVADAAEAEAAVKWVQAQEDIAVLLVTPAAAAWMPETVERLKISGRRPLLTVIPASDGEGLGADAIMGLIRQAIGVKL